MPTTLQDLRKAKYPTIKAFAASWGYSTSKASYLLRGKYQYTITKEEVQKLADILEVSFDQVVDAANNTYMEDRDFVLDRDWKLKDRWVHQEKIYEEARKWSESRDRGHFYTINLPWRDTFSFLGLTSSATEAEIKHAFRDKVREMADGKGGYNGDMDKLVQAKEKALAHARKV
jgi:transcriptional regulator with XRE-family HTH domain